jgi:PAS domain S-box-containing protein
VFAQTLAKVQLQSLTAALRESEERFRRLSDATFEGIAIHEKGIIIEANSAFAKMLGWELADVIGHGAADFFDPASLPVIMDHIAHPRDEAYTVLARRIDGSTFDAEITSRDFPWKGRVVRVVAMRDITERKKAQRAIIEREALAMQNEQLREMDTIKTQFINSAAHELGTPLTPIKLQAHLLRLGSLGELNEKQRGALDVLSRNVDHLGHMVKDLLDASRVQSHELAAKAEPMDLNAILSEAAEAYASRAIPVVYHGEPDLRVEGDPTRILQVAFNLLGNAVKFTPPGGSIDMRAHREGDAVHVEVADTGVGIGHADLPKLFHPFSQVHDTSEASRPGAGLGLFIAKGIVESHGGRMWAESAGPGHGATFHFTLPLRQSLAPQVPPPTRP